MNGSKQITIKQWIADRLKHGRPISYSEAIEELFIFKEEYERNISMGNGFVGRKTRKGV